MEASAIIGFIKASEWTKNIKTQRYEKNNLFFNCNFN
jgi:hypothetical protein